MDSRTKQGWAGAHAASRKTLKLAWILLNLLEAQIWSLLTLFRSNTELLKRLTTLSTQHLLHAAILLGLKKSTASMQHRQMHAEQPIKLLQNAVCHRAYTSRAPLKRTLAVSTASSILSHAWSWEQ